MSKRLGAGVAVLALIAAASAAEAAPAKPRPGAATSASQREILPQTARPVNYRIEIEPDAAAGTFRGRAVLTFDQLTPSSRVVVNGADLKVLSAALDGRPVRTTSDAALQRLAFAAGAPIAPGRHRLEIAYEGKINESANGLFYARYKDASGGEKAMLTTQFEPGDARRLVPSWDEPAYKATFDVAAIAPAGHSAISNMPPVKTEALDGGKVRTTFATSPKMSSYLLYLATGEFDRPTDRVGDVELGIVTRKGEGEKGRYALEVTKQTIPYYNDYFGQAYPLPKLDQIAAPGAGGFGAMENWGAILYFEPLVLLDPNLSTAYDKQQLYLVVAHEQAHQWFGDLVTMQWWDDLWLNEGFASWMENKVTDHFHPEWNVWLSSLAVEQEALALDSRATTHPIVQTVLNLDQANQAFDRITYEKGKSVIRMLEAYVGEAGFRDGVRAYMAQHKYGNTVTADLWKAVEAASGKPVTGIADDFTRQAGVPLITVSDVRCAGGDTTATLTQGRFGLDAPSKEPRRWRVPVTARVVGGGVGRTIVDGTGTITVAGCGPLKVNAGQTGYFRVAYAEAPGATIRDAFGRLSAADQLGLLYDSYALGTGGYASLADYMGLADRAAPDADPLVWIQIAETLRELSGWDEGRPSADAFRAYARSRLSPALQRIGWEARDGETENVSVLRGALITALSRLGDAAVAAEAKRRFEASLNGGAPLSAGIRKAVVGAVGRDADATTFARLQSLGEQAIDPNEQQLYLFALAETKDPSLAARVLDYAVSDKVSVQLAPGLVQTVASHHPDLAWRFAIAHERELQRGIDPLRKTEFLPSIAQQSKDPARVTDLRAWSEKTLPAGSRRNADEAIGQMLFVQKVRAERLPDLDRWLAARGG